MLPHGKGSPMLQDLCSYWSCDVIKDHHLHNHCCNRLRDFSEWDQCQVMDLIKCYQPASEDEIFDLLVSDNHRGTAHSTIVQSAAYII